MKLFAGKIDSLAHEIVSSLTSSEAIEVSDEMFHEVVEDVAAIFKEYVRTDREITERARDIIASQHKSPSDLKRIRLQLAKERNFGIEEEAIEYLIRQIIETLMYSKHVEEVYAMDNEIAVLVRPLLEKALNADEELEAEVRRRIKNLQEGTLAWEIQHRKIREELKRARRLEE